MMEFFISKVWAFVVAMAIMGVLVQGIQMEARSDNDASMDRLAEELVAMFDAFVETGPGMEVTIDLERMLPSTTTLTLYTDHGVLENGGREVSFTLPSLMFKIEGENDELHTVDRLSLTRADRLTLNNRADGSTMVTLNR